MPHLDWPDKDQARMAADRGADRLLHEVPALSYGDSQCPNLLIEGDNLDVMSALLPQYAGRVKCVFIDPPYNTRSVFQHYDDNMDHAAWLGLMYPRLVLLRRLLADDGFLCCHIDDSEGAYIKVMLDEIFGRSNYQTTFYSQVRYGGKTLKEDMAYHKQMEYAYIYRKSPLAKPIRPKMAADVDKFNHEVRIMGEPARRLTLGGKRVEIYVKGSYEIIKHEKGFLQGFKEIWATGAILDGNSSGRFFRDNLIGRADHDGLGVIYKVYDIGGDAHDHRFFTGPQKPGATKGKYYQGVPQDQPPCGEKNMPIATIYDFADRFGNCRHEGGVDFRSGKKPEHYLQLILSCFSQKGDLVLDAFLGSGSTAAAALKMGRRFIGIESAAQAVTHCQKRLQAVVDGDMTGISDAEEWAGGGGFRFYRLGPRIDDAQ